VERGVVYMISQNELFDGESLLTFSTQQPQRTLDNGQLTKIALNAIL
jgi:hypothetical protein